MKFSCDPRKWGSSAWVFLHSIALCYPENPSEMDEKHYKMFFLSLPYVLPCITCQENLLRHMSGAVDRFDRAFVSRDALIRWVIDLHNLVNVSLRKPKLSYTQAIALHDTR